MIDLLDKYSAKYHLQLGDYNFSPLIKLTTGISLEYCNGIKDKKCQAEPFIFCFPEKKAAALWTSISILTNYYLDDYIDVSVEGLNFKLGDKVQFFGCVAEIERVSQNGEVLLKFKDQGQIPVPNRLKSQLSHCSSKRVLNKYSNYRKARKEAKEKRNPISKILEHDSDALVNQKNLTSKILLVAGRGQVKTFHEFLETVEIYGEKLGRIFPEGENLIITADLKKYKNAVNLDDELDDSDFIRILNRALELPKFEEIFESLQTLLDIYNENGEISEEFDDQFNDLISEAIENIPELKILNEKYPGISKTASDDFRAVIVNDIQQLSDYPDTINAFLNANIPVIAFADRKIIGVEDINAFRSLFDQRINAYRLNWNKKKISSLISYSEGLDKIELFENKDGTYYYIDPDSGNEIPWTEDLYIDQAFWNQAMRYENQSIHIYTYPGSQLDSIMPRLLKNIKLLDGFEVLQKSFYNNLYPAIFALKNSASSSESVSELIARFKTDLLNVVSQIPADVSEDFVNIIEIAEAYEGCRKDIEYAQDTFSINVPLDFDKSFTIPVNTGFTNIPTNETQNIVFTGYPFKEYSGKYLINSVCKFFVPEIEIKCWPTEASLTHNYLKRRIEGGYFYDNLPSIVDIDDSLILKTEIDIQAEIESYLIIDQIIEEDHEVETLLQSVDQFKYKGYQLSLENSASWKVKCDVLNFEDGSFMFLKKGSSILCLSEDLKGGSKVLKKNSDQFYTGDIIFRYIKDRGMLVEISKRDSIISQSYEELEYWRGLLQDLFLANNQNTKTLEVFLRKTKENSNLEGNPAHYNLNRWLFDDEVISPDEDNLELILRAAEVPNMEDRLATLRTAYKIATAHRISLSTRIKKEIAKKISKIRDLNDGFHINVDGVYIDVETRTISAVDTNGVIVDYYNTRKILC